MKKIDIALARYEKTFGDAFPTVPLLMSNSDEVVVKMIEECIEANQDVYDMGILSLDDIY